MGETRYKVTAGGNWQVEVSVAEHVAAALKAGLPKLHRPDRAALRVHPSVADLLPRSLEGVPIYGDGRHVDTVEEVTRRGWFRAAPGEWENGGSHVQVESWELASGGSAIRIAVDDVEAFEGASLTVPKEVALDLGRRLLELAGESDG